MTIYRVQTEVESKIQADMLAVLIKQELNVEEVLIIPLEEDED